MIYELLLRGAPAAGVVFINGALEQNFVLPAHVKWCGVYYNAGDKITELAVLGAKFDIVDSDYGALGHGGYIGDDPRIEGFDAGSTIGMPAVAGHSAIAAPDNLPHWGSHLANFIRSHLP